MTTKADREAYAAETEAMRRFEPEYTVVMTGENSAIVAETRLIQNRDYSESKETWHFRVSRPSAAGYWRRYNENTGEWKQLFGRYGAKGNAMTGNLPGRLVKTADDLPAETA